MERTSSTSTSAVMQEKEVEHDSTPTKPTSYWRKTYSALGFQKGYNFPLFIIFAGAMFGFTLARLQYLNIGGTVSTSFANGASPGEWFWFRHGIYRTGITIHLGAILPAGLLMIWQFIPIIRHKFLIFHRINGYTVVALVLISNAGAIMICRRAFGGTIDTQAAVGILVILTTTSISLAYYNIKRLQIDQHRAWMLRAMFYLGTIITMRFIMILSAVIITMLAPHQYSTTMSCAEIAFIASSQSKPTASYPQCTFPNSNSSTIVNVPADLGSGYPEQLGASLEVSFGMAIWLAIILHVIGVEIYLNLTPRETERLRKVSYERQMERGFMNPGSSGLTGDRWGDAEPWTPTSV